MTSVEREKLKLWTSDPLWRKLVKQIDSYTAVRLLDSERTPNQLAIDMAFHLGALEFAKITEAIAKAIPASGVVKPK